MRLGIISRFWFSVGRFPLSKYIFKYIRNSLLKIKVIKHSGRQDYKIGNLKKRYSKKDLNEYLLIQGFENDYYAWIDDNQVFSLRKLMKGGYQYHIRLFKDDDVRGHYEYAPDCYPVRHYFGKVFNPNKKYFTKLLVKYVNID